MKIMQKYIFFLCCFFFSGLAFTEELSIVDDDTNLEWELKGALHDKWDDAVNYCNKLSTDGGNWRLPNENELHSIINYAGEYTNSDEGERSVSFVKLFLIDSTSLNVPYWSSTVNLVENDTMVSINFGRGEHFIIQRNISDTSSYGDRLFDGSPRTRCVRTYRP